MPKYEPNSRFSDCWSSTGNVTFFHRNGVCYWKRKPQCTFPGTEGQLAVLELHRRALAAWRSLKHQVQLQWNGYAEAAPSHRPPFDGTTHITGHNLFVSAYHGFAQLGDEHIPEPAPWEPFPIVWMGFHSADEIRPGTLRLRLRVNWTELRIRPDIASTSGCSSLIREEEGTEERCALFWQWRTALASTIW